MCQNGMDVTLMTSNLTLAVFDVDLAISMNRNHTVLANKNILDWILETEQQIYSTQKPFNSYISLLSSECIKNDQFDLYLKLNVLKDVLISPWGEKIPNNFVFVLFSSSFFDVGKIESIELWVNHKK